MGTKIVFMRRTEKEMEIFGGQVFIDMDGRNIGTLGIEDFVIELSAGVHKFKMYKSHTYNTFIGVAEVELDVKEDEQLLIQYSPPMLVNQPGNIVVSNFSSQNVVDEIVFNNNKALAVDQQHDLQKKEELEEKNRNGVLIFVVIIVIITIIYAVQMSSIYSGF